MIVLLQRVASYATQYLGAKLMKALLKKLGVALMKKLIRRWLVPELQAFAASTENKIDDILVDKENVENALKMIDLGIDKIAEKI